MATTIEDIYGMTIDTTESVGVEYQKMIKFTQECSEVNPEAIKDRLTQSYEEDRDEQVEIYLEIFKETKKHYLDPKFKLPEQMREALVDASMKFLKTVTCNYKKALRNLLFAQIRMDLRMDCELRHDFNQATTAEQSLVDMSREKEDEEIKPTTWEMDQIRRRATESGLDEEDAVFVRDVFYH